MLSELSIQMLATKTELINDGSRVAKIFAGRIKEWVQVLAALETALKDAEHIAQSYKDDLSRYGEEIRNLVDQLNASEKREAGLREAFETASKRVAVGQTKRLMFRCMHCKKDTPLMIDGLLDLANKALKESEEATDAE